MNFFTGRNSRVDRNRCAGQDTGVPERTNPINSIRVSNMTTQQLQLACMCKRHDSYVVAFVRPWAGSVV